MLHAALLLAIFFGFYKLLLQKETFYGLNRAVLLVCISLCFLLPLFKIPAAWSMQGGTEVIRIFEPKIERASLPVNQADSNLESAKVSKDTGALSGYRYNHLLTWAWYLYWFGVAAFGITFILQLAVLLYTAFSKPSIIDGTFRIVELDSDKAPCSFFNIIFINPEKYDWETYNAVLNHEKIHASQGHSLDIMLAETALVFQWFNPFAWLYRKELECNLEYLTDEAVLLKNDTDKAVYQESLLKVAVPQLALRLTANYNQSLLKKRFLRMEVKKSNLHTLWKYSFLLPLCFVLVCAFNAPTSEKRVLHNVSKGSMETHSLYLMTTEGLWYAALEARKVNFYLRPVNSGNKSSAQLIISAANMSDFIDGSQDKFELSREAGTMIFTGEFEEGKGLGQYRFVPDEKYQDYMSSKVFDFDANAQFAFFFLDITKKYVDNSSVQGMSAKQLISRRSNKVDKHLNSRGKSIAAKSASYNLDSKPLASAGLPSKQKLNSSGQEITYPHGMSPENIETLRDEARKRALEQIDVKKGREDAGKRALSKISSTNPRSIQAEKHATKRRQSDSLKKKPVVHKVETPVVIKVER
jgi:hypothetical protein